MNAASPNNELNIKTNTGTVLDVNDNNTMPFLDLTGYTRTYYPIGASNGDTLVTSAANTNGFVIAHLHCTSSINNSYAAVALDNIRVFSVHPYNDTIHSFILPRPIKVPSGVKVSLDKTAYGEVSIMYKQL